MLFSSVSCYGVDMKVVGHSNIILQSFLVSYKFGCPLKA